MDGVSSNNGLVTIITTNHVKKLDSALLRPGRINLMVKFGIITRTQLKDILKMYSIKLKNKSINALMELTKNYELVPATYTDFMFRYHLSAKRNEKVMSEILNDTNILKLFNDYLKEISPAIDNNNCEHMYS